MGKFIACLLGGWFGLHKFMEKKTGLGVLYLLTGGLLGIGWLVDCIVYLVKWLSTDKPKEAVTVEPEPAVESPYIFLRFKVAGVTFKNGRKTRQAILRAFKWGDEIPETIDFEVYEYEGRPAVYVKINDQVVGNIPADTTEKFLEHEKLYKRDNVHCDIYGGSKLDDGNRTNYGCEIIIRYLRERS